MPWCMSKSLKSNRNSNCGAGHGPYATTETIDKNLELYQCQMEEQREQDRKEQRK